MLQKDPSNALFWSRIMHYGVCFLPAFFTHYVYTLLNLQNEKKKLIYISYAGAFLLCAANFFGLLVPSVSEKLYFRYYTDPGILYPILMGYFSIFITVTHLEMYKVFNATESGTLSQQLKYMFLASGIGYSAGSWTYGPVYGFWAPPFIMYFMVLYVFIMGYAIVIHRLFDIQLIIRRTLIFAGLLAFVFGVFSMATFFVQEILSKFWGAGNTWTYGISLFLIVLGYDPIRNALVNLTDKFLFQKKYDYQKLLKDASRGMSKIESLDHLLALVIHFITMKMRVRSAAVLSREKRSGDFEMTYQRGYDRGFLAYHLDDTNPLIAYLIREKEAVDIEHVREYIEAGNRKSVKGEAPHQYDFQAILHTMQEINAACCIPSFLGHELRNILILGEKKSGNYYTNDDLNVLYTLAQESAIAIENARLFDEAITKSKQLEKINEQLEFSKTLLMKALHETEIANKQLQDTQAQLIHEQKMATLGRLAASVGHEVNNPLTILSMNVSRAILKYRKNPDLRVGEVLDLFQKMEQNIARIKAVVNTLTGLLRRSEKGKFEPLSLKLVLEETLPLVQFQTYLDNLTGTEVEFDIPSNIPLIRGDLERLQEVFLNLFINAYHAMTGRRNRKIRVTALIDTEDRNRVSINFTDNGSGMSEEVMKKIFNYGFTTKPPGKGSGLGLYMCKYIVELHGGDMKVASKVGEGTTFTIYLPTYEEMSSSSDNVGGTRLPGPPEGPEDMRSGTGS